jgi:succinyl-CoA synthetase beta subunit
MALLHEAWHRVLLKVAQDKQFLINLFEGIANTDELLKGVLEIVKKREENALMEGVCLNRIDYYNNEEGEPKLTEYNLQCVGMMSNMERFQDAKRLLEGDSGYVSSPSVNNFALAVR